MVKIWKKQVPDMAHIWKIAGGIQSKYGFNNKALSLSFVQYGVDMEPNFKTEFTWA